MTRCNAGLQTLQKHKPRNCFRLILRMRPQFWENQTILWGRYSICTYYSWRHFWGQALFVLLFSAEFIQGKAFMPSFSSKFKLGAFLLLKRLLCLFTMDTLHIRVKAVIASFASTAVICILVFELRELIYCFRRNDSQKLSALCICINLGSGSSPFLSTYWFPVLSFVAALFRTIRALAFILPMSCFFPTSFSWAGAVPCCTDCSETVSYPFLSQQREQTQFAPSWLWILLVGSSLLFRNWVCCILLSNQILAHQIDYCWGRVCN